MHESTYDDIPYESRALPQSHPRHLAVMARLHGLTPPDPERARVLEIGCASGGNLIPMAWHTPAGRFLGVELAASQARVGQARIARLGLDNVAIRAMDVLELSETPDAFDYIIAHGVFSWAPAPVREKILTLCGTSLAANGIALVSYNTLPGWRMRGMVRDMLLHHGRGEEGPGARLAMARQMLTFLDDSLTGTDTLHAQYLRFEAQRLLKKPPGYLFHEFLEELNQPFLFREFLDLVAGHGLEYVTDADLEVRPEALLPEKALSHLQELPDPLEREQYGDFLLGRNFRMSLITRAGNIPRREMVYEGYEELAYCAHVVVPQPLDLARAKGQIFVGGEGKKFSIHHPLTKAAVGHLSRVFPESVAMSDLIPIASEMVRKGGGAPLAMELDHLLGELISLCLRGAVWPMWRAECPESDPGPRPRIASLTREQAMAGEEITIAHHRDIRLDPFTRRLVVLLDGSRYREEIIAQLTREVMGEELVLPEGGSLRGEQAIQRKVATAWGVKIDLLARHGLFRERGGGP